MHTLGQSTDHAAVAISRRLCSCCQCPNTSLDQCMWIVGMSVRLCTSKLGAGRHADQGKERTSPHTHIQCRHQHHQEHNQHHQHVRAVTDTHTSVASPSTFVKSSAGAWRLPTAFFGCWQSHVRLASSQSTSALAESALARLASAQTQYSHWTVVSHKRSMQGPSTSGLAHERAAGCGRRYNAAEQHLRCNCDPHSNDPQSSTRPTRTPLLVSASGE